MLMKWSDLEPGDILMVSKQALEKYKDQHWTREPYWAKSLFIVVRVIVSGHNDIEVEIQDSMYTDGHNRIIISLDGSLPGERPDCPFFELISVSGEDNDNKMDRS